MEASRLKQNAEKNAVAKSLLGGLKSLVEVHGGPWSADEHPVPGADTPLVMPDR